MLDTLNDLDRCPLSPGEKEALRFAETMTTNHSSMTEENVRGLRAHYDDDQIVEIASVVGMFNYLNRFAETLGLWPTGAGEGGPDDEGRD